MIVSKVGRRVDASKVKMADMNVEDMGAMGDVTVT